MLPSEPSDGFARDAGLAGVVQVARMQIVRIKTMGSVTQRPRSGLRRSPVIFAMIPSLAVMNGHQVGNGIYARSIDASPTTIQAKSAVTLSMPGKDFGNVSRRVRNRMRA